MVVQNTHGAWKMVILTTKFLKDSLLSSNAENIVNKLFVQYL